MPSTKSTVLTARGVSAAFREAAGTVERTWEKVSTNVPADTKIIPIPFLGSMPMPEVLSGSRNIRAINSFNHSITNDTHVVTFLIDQELWEDDQSEQVRMMVSEIGAAWSIYKNKVFADALINGDVAGFTAFDGLVFFADTRATGSLGLAFDNKNVAAQLASLNVAAASTVATAAEVKSIVADYKALFRSVLDDQGLPYNSAAASNVTFVIPPIQEIGWAEAKFATMISNTSNNVVNNWFDFVVNDSLTTTAEIYAFATGAPRKGMLYSERLPLQINVATQPELIDQNGGVMVYVRERFAFGYGDPRRAALGTLS